MDERVTPLLFYPRLTTAGGAERLLIEELRAVLAAGWAGRVATLELKEDALFDHQELRNDIDCIPGRRLPLQLLALRRFVKRLEPDVIVAHGHIAAWYVAVACLGLGIPYVVHLHGTLFWFHDDRLKYALVNRRVFGPIRRSVVGHQAFVQERWRASFPARLANELRAILDQVAIRRAAGIVTLTEQLPWELQKLYGRGSIVARGCLDEAMLTPRDATESRMDLGLPPGQLLFSVGRLDPRKRIDVAIRAFSLVAVEFPSSYLVIGGTGEERERLEELVASLGLANRVTFAGFIPDHDLPKYYAASDLFLFPSWTTSGITPYEALAQGAHVVWTSEACEPVLDDPNVFVADPNPEDIARAIREALSTPRGGPSDVKLYSWSNYFDPVLNLIRKVANASKSQKVQQR